MAPHFDEVGKFSGGLAYARIGDRRGYIDKTGMFVWSTRLINSK
ncbi:MAG: hypothetical protein HC856_07020 [Pseudanabaena sp. RU_4_16]|nr:hypothetical protein [Pseudanabaena sp. RU_4_16]